MNNYMLTCLDGEFFKYVEIFRDSQITNLISK
ncbi:BnaA05g15800D [Brassica napus]|uniref:BnaA05g15800D protein n=1 Tax=Brassica napus TaxID=3708 RepID=A0A078GT08_BRANA|nr:BnaA05g15800D [Brassica napus]